MALSVVLTITEDPSRSPNYSPWLDQSRTDRPVRAVDHDFETDVVVVGAGIAGVATAYFLLRETRLRVTLLEGWRVAHGATGHNAGQLVSYFERPLCRLAEDVGPELAAQGQRDVDTAWGLFDVLLGETEYPVPVPRIVGHLGMFTLNHLSVHLQNNLIRKRFGLVREHIRISEKAEFLRDIPPELEGLYDVVAQERIQQILETEDTRYRATLSGRKGCANSALVCEHVVEYLLASYPHRFELYEGSSVGAIELARGRALLRSMDHEVKASRVVLCTNGFSGIDVRNAAGADIALPALVSGTVGYMAAYVGKKDRPVRANSYLMSPRIGEGQAYFYVTRRPWERAGERGTLTCIGGPDLALPDGGTYVRDTPYPTEELRKLNAHIAPVMGWPTGQAPRYDYLWHGLMGYTPGQIRIIGAEPRNPALLYNLGCNGVGLLPSLHGAWRISQLVGGATLAPSMFDPR